MKLCFLADCRSLHTKRWLEYFARDNEVHLITIDYPYDSATKVTNKDYRDLGIIVHKIPKKLVNLAISPIAVKNMIQQIKPDIVHAHYATQYGFCGAFSGFHPFVLSVWGSDILVDPGKNRAYREMVRYALRHADLITCDGENYSEAFVQFGTDLEKVKIIYHGIDTRQFSPTKRDRSVFSDLSVSDTTPVVIFIRGFFSVYDPETLIRSFPSVIREIPEAHFILIGEGDQKQSAINLVHDLGVSSAVSFVGWIPHDRLPEYLASADVYVSTSLSDGGAVVSTLEAMASGLPPVVTDVGDHRIWVQDGKNGFVIPPKDPETLAERIIILLKDRDMRRTFGIHNRAIVEEQGDYYREMAKMEKIYEILVMRNST
jgi:glycosyltransferase involved in cell wall biosynthesis